MWWMRAMLWGAWVPAAMAGGNADMGADSYTIRLQATVVPALEVTDDRGALGDAAEAGPFDVWADPDTGLPVVVPRIEGRPRLARATTP